MTNKVRLDSLLVEKGFFTAREKARRAVLAGEVRINDIRIDKPGTVVDPQAFISIKKKPIYVSRGADKLIKALDEFKLDVAGKVCLDAGASTGGFTDVLLRRKAKRVFAVDVGYGQLEWTLRSNDRVTVLERTNVRYLKREDVPESVDVVTADLSFISLKKVSRVFMDVTKDNAQFIFLIKPQFEAGRGDVGKGGVVRNAEIHKRVLQDLAGFFDDAGLEVHGLTYSPMTGADGNIEFLMFLEKDRSRSVVDSKTIECVVTEAHKVLDKPR